MKAYNLVTINLLTFLLLAGCQPKEPAGITTIDILKGAGNEKEFRLSEIIDDVEYVKLETTKECLLAWASYSVGEKYILAVQNYDPAQIYLFGRDGKFIRKIGGEGKGPQEYTSLSTVVTDPEETFILANDYQRDVIIRYDFEGNVTGSFASKEQLGGEVAGILVGSSDEIWLRMEYPMLETKNFCLIRKINREWLQTDSLYPVSTGVTAGNGFSWNSGDFYLYNGSLRFRQFGFDTLFTWAGLERKPLAVFPVAADHLPGPYLVSGLHKRMSDYTNVFWLAELPGYFILGTMIAPGRQSEMVYNKSTGELFSLKKLPPCPPDTVYRRRYVNDIDGISDPSVLLPQRGLFTVAHQVIDLRDKMAPDCGRPSEIRFPEKRAKLVTLVGASSEEDNPILQIFRLKRE
jgi:hypothetical protein